MSSIGTRVRETWGKEGVEGATLETRRWVAFDFPPNYYQKMIKEPLLECKASKQLLRIPKRCCLFFLLLSHPPGMF